MTVSFLALAIHLAGSACSFAEDDACARVRLLTIAGASITRAALVEAGAFTESGPEFSDPSSAAFYKSLPAFCRVSATARPTPDSDIRIEVWLPVAGWNQRFQGQGNGGFAGSIEYRPIGVALRQGYAVATTDTGHTGSPIDARWALGHPEKIVDFGHRGVHEMTRVGRAVVQAFYGTPARKAYFLGCSDGGREALMEAQRYPDDYDGILAGAPANHWTALLTSAAWTTRALTGDPASFIPPQKIPVIAEAVTAACDALDGVKDGVLADPRQCHFKPASIQCKADTDGNSCLTSQQVAALERIYQGPRDASGRQVFPGVPPGGETGDGGWELWITGPAPGQSLLASFVNGYFSEMVYGSPDRTISTTAGAEVRPRPPDWTIRNFDLEKDLHAAVTRTASVLDATDPNLEPFRARGGKLILYHGWQDPAISALSTVEYFDSVVARLGDDATGAFARLYMAPGVQHCSGGPGPDAFGQAGKWSPDDPARNLRVALEHWVEQGVAPDRIIAAKYVGEGDARRATMSRPLCPYPQQARYKGSGDPNDEGSFECAAPR